MQLRIWGKCCWPSPLQLSHFQSSHSCWKAALDWIPIHIIIVADSSTSKHRRHSSEFVHLTCICGLSQVFRAKLHIAPLFARDERIVTRLSGRHRRREAPLCHETSIILFELHHLWRSCDWNDYNIKHTAQWPQLNEEEAWDPPLVSTWMLTMCVVVSSLQSENMLPAKVSHGARTNTE